MTEDFEPRIVGFLCNWCSYAGADLCGVSRYQYPPNIRVIRVMCSARVDPTVVMEMFLQGADAVFVGGCHLGDCHYITGNYLAKRRMEMLEYVVGKTGLDPRRLRLEWISASEGLRFANVMTEFTDEVKKLGPNPLTGDDPDLSILEAVYVAENVVSDFRIRALTTKWYKVVEQKNVYGESISEERYREMLEKAIDEEFSRLRIMYSIRYDARSVTEISEATKISPKEVLEHIVNLKERGLVTMTRMDGNIPYYQCYSDIKIPASIVEAKGVRQ